jgi:serine/threonine protein kinase
VAVSEREFWRLAEESRLLSAVRCEQLAEQFAKSNGAHSGAAKNGAEPANRLAAWLVSGKQISSYQSTILLAGRPGPFVYGDYLIRERIERGRLSGWFRATHVATGHGVLLAFAAGKLLKDPAAWSEAAERARQAANIVDSRVVRLFDAVDLRSFKFFVLEDPPGSSLEGSFIPGERLSVSEACRAAREIALALAQLHRAGLAHGDVRPASMWRGPDGAIRLLLDPSRPPAPIDAAEQAADLAERADYFAPELAKAGKLPDRLSDIYALGCTLYRLLAGRPPFPGGDAARKMHRHASERIEPLEPLGVPATLARTVAFLMAKKASLRTASADLAAEQLAEFIVQQGPPSSPKPTASLTAFEAALRGRQFTSLRSAPAAAPPLAQPAPQAPLPPAPVAIAPPPAPVAPVIAPRPSATPVIVATGGTGRSKRQKKQQLIVLSVAGLGLALTALFVVVALANKDTAKETVAAAHGDAEKPASNPRAEKAGARPKPGEKASDRKPTATSPTGEGSSPQSLSQNIVPDDGRRLWASPTSGPPVDRSYVPPDARVLLFLRPADLLADGEGRRAVAALGPDFQAARTAWEAAAGVKWEDLETLTVTLHAEAEHAPRMAFVAGLQKPRASAEHLAAWGNPPVVKEEAGEYYQKAAWCFYLPSEAEGRVFAMGAKEEIAALAAGEAAPLRREVEQLLRHSDGDRHLTAVFAPDSFFGDGRKMFAGEYAKILDPLEWFLGDGLKAGSFSAHLGDELYVEARLVAEIGIDEYQLSTQLQDRLATVPEKIDEYIAAMNPPAYWRKVAFRYPRMIHMLHQQTRLGAENDQAVLNAVLPKVAAHNLLAASEVVVATAPGAAAAAAAPTPAGPKTMAEVLQAKISLSFPSQSLEFAMNDVAEAVREAHPKLPFEFRVRVIGADLEAGSITRNQTVANFDQRDKSVAEVLTALCLKANPVTTVKSPDEADQRLIWVVAADPQGADGESVIITTRDAAASKGYTLPAVFQPKGA